MTPFSPGSTAVSFNQTRFSTECQNTIQVPEGRKMPPISPERQSMIKEKILRKAAAEHFKNVDEIQVYAYTGA
jgi:hypothetical protein